MIKSWAREFPLVFRNRQRQWHVILALLCAPVILNAGVLFPDWDSPIPTGGAALGLTSAGVESGHYYVLASADIYRAALGSNDFMKVAVIPSSFGISPPSCSYPLEPWYVKSASVTMAIGDNLAFVYLGQVGSGSGSTDIRPSPPKAA